MKKLIILILALALCLTACSKPEFLPEDQQGYNPIIDEIIETTKIIAPPTEIDKPTTTIVEITANIPPLTTVLSPTTTPSPTAVIRNEDFGVGLLDPFGSGMYKWEFDSLDVFAAFVQRSEQNRTSGSSRNEYLSSSNDLSVRNAIMPILPGFELTDIEYLEEKWISYSYKLTDYVYNEKLSESDNFYLSRAIVAVSYSPADEWNEYIKWYMQGNWSILTEHSGTTICYSPGYFSESNSELLVCHVYAFIVGNKFVYIRLPALPGLSALDMVKYLEMVPVM
jgi:hypothetical protein